MLVYRIQNELGRGPYSFSWGEYVSEGIRHPGPLEDSGMADEWRQKIFQSEGKVDYHFGFTSETQLRTWFYRDKWLHAMKEHGLKLTVWEVPFTDVIVGHTQLAFIRERAMLVETRELI
jgi:hypothetical protein